MECSAVTVQSDTYAILLRTAVYYILCTSMQVCGYAKKKGYVLQYAAWAAVWVTATEKDKDEQLCGPMM